MGLMDAPEFQKVSWSDYLSWEGDSRWEVIGGHPYAMTAPRVSHQRVCGQLFVQLHQHFSGKTCEPFLSPIDVKLSEHDIVQPDLIVVCDSSKIKDTHIEGPPSLIVEVLSPSTQRHDRIRKLRLYAASGVQEYWLLQPYPAIAEVLSLKDGEYRIVGTFTEAERLDSPNFPGLSVNLSDVFPMPSEDETIEEVRESAPPAYQTDRSQSVTIF